MKFYKSTIANTQLLDEQLNSTKLQNELLEKRVKHLHDVHSSCDMTIAKMKEYERIVKDEFNLVQMLSPAEFKQKLHLLKNSDSDLSKTMYSKQVHKVLKTAKVPWRKK